MKQIRETKEQFSKDNNAINLRWSVRKNYETGGLDINTPTPIPYNPINFFRKPNKESIKNYLEQKN